MTTEIVRITHRKCGEIFYTTQHTQGGQTYFALSVCCPKCSDKITGIFDDTEIELVKPKEKRK